MTAVSGCWNSASANDQRYQELNMGTWGTGPFDSDLAADFVDELEGLSSEQIINVLHGPSSVSQTPAHGWTAETGWKPSPLLPWSLPRFLAAGL
ncbi:DUF4259 domain-containing protein [Streptomyces sp. DT2A-34]|uniref:DUF4259 domain-containing protein n=1 Tax=Streptomyces sp. DT2A-34 TaxID=3051182 RepID=UPI00265C28C5|nr:DUF4259 domain-containing protein [Streptomyces sp. DT2A-34]MDO0916979.1 DUF4259 domain-containing protein [Streptomyces sp. DT2A-34]